jgi:hypothetical protein
MQWSTLPSECRQRKDPYLALLGGKGGEASTFQGGQSLAFPPFVDMQNIASQAASQPRGQPSVVPRVGVADDQRLHGYSSGQWIVPLPL